MRTTGKTLIFYYTSGASTSLCKRYSTISKLPAHKILNEIHLDNNHWDGHASCHFQSHRFYKQCERDSGLARSSSEVPGNELLLVSFSLFSKRASDHEYRRRGRDRFCRWSDENLSCVEIDKFLEEVSQRAVKAGGDVERAVPFDVSSSEQSPGKW